MSDRGFVRGHSVARVLAIAVPLVVLAIWWGSRNDHGAVSSITEVPAVVVRIEGRTCLVRLQTGEQVRIIRWPELREGLAIRLARTQYKDGAIRYRMIRPEH